MYVHGTDSLDSKLYSCIGDKVPQGARVSFKVNPNIPTLYTHNSEDLNKQYVGLKFIGPDGSGESTFLGTKNYAATESTRWSAQNLDSNLTEGTWTVWAYFVPVDKVGYFASYTPEEYLNGQKYQFTITTSTVSMSAASNTAKVGGYVTITISGKPNDVYYLKPNDKYAVNPGQQNFNYTVVDGKNQVTIGKDGTTTLTLKAVKDGTFTLQLCDAATQKIVEEDLELTFTKSKITAEVEKDRYYMGTDVKLTGTNEAGYSLYYYIEGTNLKFSKINPKYLEQKNITNWETTIKGSWIGGKNLDTAAYTVYISSVGPDKTKEEVTGPNAVVSTVTVLLIKPQITITSSTSIVIQDENLVVKGVAETASQVRYYIFGNNKHHSDTVDVGRNGNFVIDKTLPKNEFDTGQYFMVVQHPMYDGHFNVAAGEANNEQVVALNTTGNALNPDGTVATDSQILFSLNERQSSNAAQALCNAIDSEDIDDIYTKCSFILKADATTVDPIPSEITRGLPFTVSGTAARVDGTSISVELLSTAFSPESKYSATSASFVTMITYPDADGKWAVTFDTSGLNIDTYNISVSANAVKVHQAVIRVAEGTAAPAAQETPAAPTAAAATPTPTPAPTKNASTPGFGAAVILAGLGAAALALSGRRL